MLKVAITRSHEGNIELANMLLKKNVMPIVIDTITYSEPDWSKVDRFLEKIEEYDWLVFTSATAVRYFYRRVKELRIPLANLKARFAAVGNKTAEALKEIGIEKSFIPSKNTTEGLASELPKEGKRVLLLRSNLANEELYNILKDRGFEVDTVSIYNVSFIQEKVRITSELDAIIFGSASEVRGFINRVKNIEEMKEIPVFCIGPVTADFAQKKGFKKIIISEEQTFEGVVKELIRRLRYD